MRQIILLFVVLVSSCSQKPHFPKIAIQPIGNVRDEKIEVIKSALDSVYDVRVSILKSIVPPQNTFVNIKSPRYRADKLIAYLKENKPDSADYIIGLTNFDVSTTKKDGWGNLKEPKNKYEDFGIFGLGYCPGKSCVVSYFRLGNDYKISNQRLAKICIHELGHNFGLPHCENKNCVMTDAVEKISTIDNAEMKLCEKCKRKI